MNSPVYTAGDLIGIGGLSCGERKRLALATELMSDLPILLADEPTTGLDYHMAKVK